MGADVLRECGERVEVLLQHFDAFPAATNARADADELVYTVSKLYGEGLRRIIDTLCETLGEGARPLLERCCDDTLIASLLITHNLHPVPLEVRVQRAIESVRPYMKSHAGDVEVVSVDEDLVQVRLQGTCDGCAASQATLKDAIERAVFATCPEVLEVRAVETDTGTVDLLPVVL